MSALKGIISSWCCVFILVPCYKWFPETHRQNGKGDEMGVDEMGIYKMGVDEVGIDPFNNHPPIIMI